MSQPGPPPEQHGYDPAYWHGQPQSGGPGQQYPYPPQQGYSPQQGAPQHQDYSPAQGYPPPQGWAAPSGDQMPPVPPAPGEPAPGTPPPPQPGRSPYGRPAPGPVNAQGSYGQFTFPAMARQRLEPTAVASVITSPLALVGLVLGLIGRRRVRTKQRRSLGLATTGIGISLVFLVVWVLVAFVLVGNGTVARWTESPQPGDVAEARTIGASNVAAGNCLGFLPPGESISEVQVTPCAEPHAAQAISVHDLDGDFPGAQALAEQAKSTCATEVSALDSSEPVSSWYFAPSQQAWREGTHRFVCMARSDSGTLSEDLVNH